MVGGESEYNARHKCVHCKVKRIPLGTFVYRLLRLQREKEMDDRTRKGVLVGFHVQPGGLWSGEYSVVDWETLQHHPIAMQDSSYVRSLVRSIQRRVSADSLSEH